MVLNTDRSGFALPLAVMLIQRTFGETTALYTQRELGTPHPKFQCVWGAWGLVYMAILCAASRGLNVQHTVLHTVTVWTLLLLVH